MARAPAAGGGIEAWAAFLTGQDLPCMGRSKLLLRAFEDADADTLSIGDLADIIQNDPFLCLRLLCRAEERRSRRLGRETTTIKAALMQLGVTGFRALLLDSPETDPDNVGLAACEARAVLASQLAAHWSKARADIVPEEVILGALLSDLGELLLWAFAPELPGAVRERCADDTPDAREEAQLAVCGFRFTELSLACARLWQLPELLIELIEGVDNVRADVSRLCVNTARHLASGSNPPALANDLVEAKRLMPHVPLTTLACCFIGLDEQQLSAAIARAEEIAGQAAMERR